MGNGRRELDAPHSLSLLHSLIYNRFSLIYSSDIKNDLLQYMYSSDYIAERSIDHSIVGCNR